MPDLNVCISTLGSAVQDVGQECDEAELLCWPGFGATAVLFENGLVDEFHCLQRESRLANPNSQDCTRASMA